MNHALSIYSLKKRKRERLRKKMAANNRPGVKAPNVARRVASEKAAGVSITYVDAQRENRQASKRWKAKARKFAFGCAIGLHAVALVVLTVWFVKKTVLQMNEDKIQSVVVDAPPPQTRRISPPRAPQKLVKPKAVQIRAPRNNTVSMNTNLSLGPASFTMQVSDPPSDNAIQFNVLGTGKDMMETTRHVKIVSTVPKFEMPKFETTGLSTQMDMGSSLAVMDFGETADLGLSAAGFGETKESFSEFLRKVRDRIRDEQRLPPNVRSLEDGSTTTIRFTLLRDGTIRDPKVSNSSGSRVLDNAALAAVQNAEPYPPFPDGQSGNSIRLELPVVFELVN